MVQFKKLTTTLPGGTNSYTFTDALINDASVIEVYTDNDDVYPVNLEQHGNSIDITLSDHADAVGVALTINNVITYEPTDISGLENEIQTVSDNLSGLSTVVNELSDNVDNIEGDVSTLGTMVTDLETSKQDVLTAGENITIENNIISASGGESSQEIYDDTERIIGTWFGRNLYRKVVSFHPTSSVFSEQNHPHNITNIDNVVMWKAFLRFTSGTVQIIPSTQFAANLTVIGASNFGAVNKTNCVFYQGLDRSAHLCFYIIEYTKVGE